MINKKYPYILPPLAYPYEALEPYIDAETMHLHHDKHFKTYVDNLNHALQPYAKLQTLTLGDILRNPNLLPYKDKVTIMRNAGGVYNHSLFFDRISPDGGDGPVGRLLTNINATFGSYEQFQKLFSENAMSVFGSGWTFLVRDKHSNLKIFNSKNQQTPLEYGFEPIITFDVWEHAYYLKYKNVRADYIKNLWNVVKFA